MISRSEIGIELSSTTARVAVIRHEAGKNRLEGFGEAPLAHGAISDGGVVEAQLVRQALLAAAKAAGLRPGHLGARHSVKVAIAGLRALARTVELPELPEEEVAAAAELQALEVIPFPADRTLVTARRVSSGPTGSRVLVEAAHRDLVEPIVALVEEAGFSVKAVELSSSALVRALEPPPPATGESEAIVSIGAELTTVVVARDGEVQFLRTIATGGADVTRAISAALDVPVEDAEEIKGLIAEMTTRVPSRAVSAAREGAGPVLREIASSLQYYNQQADGAPVCRVVLVGGGAELLGLRELLSVQVGIPVVSRSALVWVDDLAPGQDRAPIARSAAVAIGLALPERRGRRAGNLLPDEVRAAARQRARDRMVVLVASAACVLALGAGAARLVQVHNAEGGVAALAGQMRALQAEEPTYHSALAIHDTAVADEGLARPIVSHEVDWPTVLATIARTTPAQVATTSLGGIAGATSVAAATTTASATVPENPDLPAPHDVLGTIDLSLSAGSYPLFQQWFNAIDHSRLLLVTQYSGLTASSSSVNFTATLEITGALHTDRLARFEEIQP